MEKPDIFILRLHPRVYAERQPEFTRGKLPLAERQHYFHLKYQGSHFFVPKGTTLLNPDLQPLAGR